MRPLVALSGRDVPRDFPALVAALNRPASRTRQVMTRIGDGIPRTYDLAYFSATDGVDAGFDAYREAGRANGTAGSTVAYAIDRLVAIPFVVNAPFLIDTIQFNITTGGGAGALARIGIYDSRDDREGRVYPGARLYDGGEVDGTSTGVHSASPGLSLEAGHVYWMAYHAGVAAPTIRSVPAAGMGILPGCDGAMGTAHYWGIYASLTYSSTNGLPTTFPQDSLALGESGAQAPALQFLYGPNPDSVVTFYRNVHWPIEPGSVVRAARLLPSTTLAANAERPGWITVALGLRAGPRFDVLGTEYDSREHALFEGVPFELTAEESNIPQESGVVLRVQQGGWPAPSLAESDVETFLGFEGGN